MTVPRRGFRIRDTGYEFIVNGSWISDSNRKWDCRFLELYSLFQSPGFRIPQAKISLFRILQAKLSQILESVLPHIGRQGNFYWFFWRIRNLRRCLLVSVFIRSFCLVTQRYLPLCDKTKNQVTWETSLKRTRMNIPAVTSSAVKWTWEKSRSEHRPRERPINFGTRLRVFGLVTLLTTLPSQHKLSVFV